MKTVYAARDVNGGIEVEILSPFMRKIINPSSTNSDRYVLKINYGEGGKSRKFPEFPGTVKLGDLIGFLEGKDLPESLIEEISGVHPYLSSGRSELLKKMKERDGLIKYQESKIKYNFLIHELKGMEKRCRDRTLKLKAKSENLEKEIRKIEIRKGNLERDIRNLKGDFLGLERYRDDQDWSKKYDELFHKYKKLVMTLIEPSRKKAEEKICGGSVNHHLPRGSDKYMMYLAGIEVIDSVWTSRLEGKILKGFKCKGNNVKFFYNDGEKTLVIEGKTVARDEFELDAVKEIIKQRLEGFS